MRYLSVCSGIEASTVAWEPLGWTPIGFAEVDPAPSKALAHHYGSNMPGEPPCGNGVPNFGDFTTIPLDRLGSVEVLVGGTPCQAFSVAGKRLSLADARGNLSLAYAVLTHELARSHGLRWAVWENVPGVLSTNDNAFGCLLAALVGGDGAIEPVARPRTGKSNAFWRWRNAGVEQNDDGEDVQVEAGHVTRWPSAGMVAGPLGRATWRILDAQYFGLAQRRRRVFVVVGVGEGADPAAVLFERAGVRRHPPTRGEAGAGVAVGTLAGTSSGGGWRVGADEAAAGQFVAGTLGCRSADHPNGLKSEADFIVPVAYGGNDTRGAINVATALNAHGGPCGRQDFESETFVVAPPLTSNPYGDHEALEGLLVTHSLRGEGFDASEDGTGRGTPIVPVCGGPGAVAILGNRARGAVPIAESGKRTGASMTSMKAGDGIGEQGDPMFTLGADSRHAVAAETTSWAVRRLTPTECERLQGFPDGYTAIPGAADGPRYKQLGNSMACTVMAWIGARIAAAERAYPLLQAAE